MREKREETGEGKYDEEKSVMERVVTNYLMTSTRRATSVLEVDLVLMMTKHSH